MTSVSSGSLIKSSWNKAFHTYAWKIENCM